MKNYQQENLKEIKQKEIQTMNQLKEKLAIKYHYLRSTQSIPGVYKKKLLSGDFKSTNPTIDGNDVDDFLKSTFKVCV